MTTLTHPIKLGGDVWISQEYGNEFAGNIEGAYYSRVYAQRFNLADGHNGIDYACPVGTPVYAPADGTIIYRGIGQNFHSTVGGWSAASGYNLVVVIDHGDILTAYLHLSKPYVRGNGAVKKGQLIGYSGETGLGTGPHLHFQVMPKPVNYWDGRWGCRNPRNYFTTATAAAGGTITPIQEDDMPYLDWPEADREALAKDVNGYVRNGEKVDLSHMVRYVYDAMQRVEKLAKASTPAKIWGHPIVSRAKSSINKKYAAWSHLSVVNGRSEDDQRDRAEILARLDSTEVALRELAKAQGIDADPIVAAIDAAADRAADRVGEAIEDSIGDVELTFTAKTPKEEDAEAEAEIAAAVAAVPNVEGEAK